MACVAMVNVSISASRTQAPQLPDILSRAAAYLERYEQQIPSVIAQEDYLQSFGGINGLTDRARTVRRLRSDLLILADETGWVEFRDVYEVDGKQVRDRDDRLMRLFMQPNPDSRVQAGRIVAESARFNLDVPRLRFRRTLNVPMTALRFLRRENQSRSAFTLGTVERRGAREVATVRFSEEAQPPLIGSNEPGRTAGSFTVDAESGRVLKSVLSVTGSSVAATITVDFAEQSTLGLWLPAAMQENYAFRTTMTVNIDGRATYLNYRQFKVDTSMTIK
jgi:hypothetical protein